MEPISLAILVVVAIFFVTVLRKIGRNRETLVPECCHTVSSPTEYDLQCEVVVIGAGVLGSAIAAVLAQDGRNVVIVERDTSEPDRIVGELLQPGGYIALTKLGLNAAVEGIDAQTVCGYVIHDIDSKSNVTLGYPLDKNNRKMMTGRSFHHGRFVMGLRDQARNNGATLMEGTVTSLVADDNGNIVGVCYKDKKDNSSKAIKADLTIVADGCFSRFRKDLSLSSASVSSRFAGILMCDCPQYKPGYAEIILTSHGPVLVYQISHSDTRILIDIRGKMPSNMNQFMMDEITPQLTAALQEPFTEALRSRRIRTMPNSFLPPSTCFRPGAILLGDAFNMRHPLTGAGMSVALNDVLIWRELLLSVPDLKNYGHVKLQQKKFLSKRRMSHSFVVNVLAQALYTLFSASDRNLLDLRRACFEYFKFGGRAATDPIGLLSIVHPNPFILVVHFFAVALYAMSRTMMSYNIRQLHHGLYRSSAIFIKACAVIFPLIRSEL